MTGWISAFAVLAGCGTADGEYGRLSQPLVNGSDDRTEYFDIDSPPLQTIMSQSMVALVPKAWIDANSIDAPTWRETSNLCPSERFADQPAAAFCSGILVDWDLVLTAGHCMRFMALRDFAVVFGYYYESPERMAIADVREPLEIVSEQLDPEGATPRLDFAWLRLRTPVLPPRRPAMVYVRPPGLEVGDPLVSMGTGGGVPLKLDGGGIVRDDREQTLDFFIADTDTSHASSGGGAFDQQLALAGVFVRGELDSTETTAGCQRTVVRADGTAAQEQFTYAHRAVEALCGQNPRASSICRYDCNDRCRAVPLPAFSAQGGCSMAACRPSISADPIAFVPLALFLRRRRRVRSGAAPYILHKRRPESP